MNPQITRDVIQHAMSQLSERANGIKGIIYSHPAADLQVLHQEVRDRMAKSNGDMRNPELCEFLTAAVGREQKLKKLISQQRRTAALSLELLSIEQQLETLTQELLLVQDTPSFTTQETFN